MTAIPAIHGLRKELGLDEETARDFYEREVGVRSLRLMTPGQQVRVAQAMRRQAAKSAGTPRKGLSGPYASKLQALWISGWQLGVVQSRTDAALLTFVERQSGIAHTRFLRDANDARKAIEGLKAWLSREAGVEWTEFTAPEDAVMHALGVRLGFADRDPDNAASPEEAGWWAWRRSDLGDADRRALAQALGALVRKQASDGKRAA